GGIRVDEDRDVGAAVELAVSRLGFESVPERERVRSRVLEPGQVRVVVDADGEHAQRAAALLRLGPAQAQDLPVGYAAARRLDLHGDAQPLPVRVFHRYGVADREEVTELRLPDQLRERAGHWVPPFRPPSTVSVSRWPLLFLQLSRQKPTRGARRLFEFLL